MKRYFLSVAMTAALTSSSAFAQLERQLDAHVHGTATGNLSLDRGDLRLELEIPGFNLVGFEHAPASEDQQAALDSAVAFLRAADWLTTDPRGGCEIASVAAHTHGFGETDDHDHGDSHSHDHHDHNHDHHDSGNDHSEFHLVAMLECDSPERLRWIDLDLFDAYPGNEEMVVDVLTATLATQVLLRSGSERIALQ